MIAAVVLTAAWFLRNHHQRRIAVYLVNSLVQREPDMQITGQRGNQLQSVYQLDYTQTITQLNPTQGEVHSMPGTSARWLDAKGGWTAAAILGGWDCFGGDAPEWQVGDIPAE